MRTGLKFFLYFTFLFINISILWKHMMRNCKLRFVFLNSLSLYILGLRATKILITSLLYFALFNFLRNHFALVSKPKINLNFYKYNAITRTDSSSNIIKFYVYYFSNYVKRALVKRTSRAVNFLNVSEIKTYGINLVVIGLFIVKVF